VGLRLLRPFLSVPKARLLAVLEAAGQPWLEDPSNRDPRFARAALRLRPGWARARWLWEGRRRAQARAVADLQLASFFAGAALPHALGWVRLDLERWRALPESMRQMALARLLLAVRGAAYPPPPTMLGRLACALERASFGWRTTAGGCILEVGRHGLKISREPGRIGARSSLRPGETIHWDRRFTIRSGAAAGPLDVEPLGASGRIALPAEMRARLRAAGVPDAAVAALPVIRDGARLTACPPLGSWGLPQPGTVEIGSVLSVATPLAGPAFHGANVVSKAMGLIYREATEPAQCPERAGRLPVDWVPRLT
jgi:tRNA(Ile)-lysidine synthase